MNHEIKMQYNLTIYNPAGKQIYCHAGLFSYVFEKTFHGKDMSLTCCVPLSYVKPYKKWLDIMQTNSVAFSLQADYTD
jgi:hypothetical protein